MCNIQLMLSERRRIPGMKAVFPANYFEIPGIRCYDDIEAVNRYTFQMLKAYRGRNIDVYINSGLALETYAVLRAASALDIRLRMFHYNSEHECYLPQKVQWKDIMLDQKLPEKELALCGGRHLGLPASAVFEEISESGMFDFAWQEEQAMQVLKGCAPCHIHLYLTGLTALGISVLNVAYGLKIPVTLYHFNYDTEEYFPQAMNAVEKNGGIYE